MKSSRSYLTIVMMTAVLCATAFAQDTASITGTVLDRSGAAIPNAQVTITNTGQGVSRTTTTNETGTYLFASLPIGSYDLAVNASGFKKYDAKGVTLQVAQKVRIDVSMQVGEANVEVVVEGTNVAQVETESSDLGGVITGKQVTQIELNGRDFKQLVTLVPGVTNQTGADEGGVGVT